MERRPPTVARSQQFWGGGSRTPSPGPAPGKSPPGGPPPPHPTGPPSGGSSPIPLRRGSSSAAPSPFPPRWGREGGWKVPRRYRRLSRGVEPSPVGTHPPHSKKQSLILAPDQRVEEA